MNNIDEVIINELKILLDDKNITLEHKFDDINIDSLIFVQLIVFAEEYFDFEFDEESLIKEKYTTVKDFSKEIEITKKYSKVNNHANIHKNF